jgi:NTE family protein
VGVSATGYTSGENITFSQGRPGMEKWRQGRSVGVPAILNVGHILGSSAIPAVLPAEKISREYFGDDALRQLAPISPVICLGADRVLVIGVSGDANCDEDYWSNRRWWRRQSGQLLPV